MSSSLNPQDSAHNLATCLRALGKLSDARVDPKTDPAKSRDRGDVPGMGRESTLLKLHQSSFDHRSPKNVNVVLLIAGFRGKLLLIF